ncbi:MAG TPA: DUF1553 domain-containing protein, partial [Planctomycetia bacterium]|nr:DUF1553 domain-containing protein [Planctomycetia bacterium]
AKQVALLKEFPYADVRYSLDLYDPAEQKKIEAERAEVAKLRATKPAETFVAPLVEPAGAGPVTRLFHRGDHDSPKGEIAPGELPILAVHHPGAVVPPKDPKRPTTGRRTAYANLLTDGKHPTVARVLVNRFWMHHFGRGIVATPADFGAFGEKPSLPELLDWLAADFMAGGWKLKRLHRLIMMSDAYRQRSERVPAAEKVDPENRLLARQNVRRLEAEAVRDAMLAAGGKLIPKVGGPSIPVIENLEGTVVLGTAKIQAGLLAGTAGVGEEENRRSLYVQARRKLPLGMLEAFDSPVMTPNCEARRATTAAPQSLMLLNSPFTLAMAEHVASAAEKEGGDDAAKARRLWRRVFAADAAPADVDKVVAFVKRHAETLGRRAAELKDEKLRKAPVPAAWAAAAQTLLCSNRFLYVD